jgi:para-nitrobenzyl esterase
MCPQYAGAGPFDAQIVSLLAGGYEIPTVSPSENCLVLNIWTPAVCDGGRRPVMVWCHGGRFTEGSGGNPWCDGSALAKQGDVVVVTLNHRLNLFGYLDLHAITEGSQHQPGNAGMLDIVAALVWIRDNIVEFGGDPGNVTLFGSSGGGSKITTLLAMPAAKGLFHKAIVQSATLRGSSRARQRQRQVALAFLTQLGLQPSHMDALHNTSAARLLRAGKAVEAARAAGAVDMGIFVPTVDGTSLLEHPFETAAPAISADVPLLIGTNADEMTLLLDRSFGSLELQDLSSALQRWAAIDGPTADNLISCYRDMLPAASARDLLVALATDYALRSSAIVQAEYKSLQAAPVYMYQFQWRVTAYGGTYGATHGAEVPFVFGNVASATGFQAEPAQYRLLQTRMVAAWTAFARTGNPNHADLPDWPAYSIAHRSTLCFGHSTTNSHSAASRNDCSVLHDPGSAGRLAMAALGAHRSIDA